MRLASFLAPGSPPDGPTSMARTGLLAGEEVIDLTDPAIGLPGDMPALLALGREALDSAAEATSSGARRWGLDEVTVLAPVPLPPKVLAIRNHLTHFAEMHEEPPAHQYWFNKQRTAVVGPGHPIVIPTVSEQVDYEGELAVVIGAVARSVPAERWLEVVAGFTVVNDVAVRDWQHHSASFTMGKSFDTHCPLGPFLVTPDEVGDAGSLSLRTWVNGELRQDASTADFLFKCGEMIEYLSTGFTLEPGDVLATGSPAGTGEGFTPPRWLRPGDTVRVEVERVGVLENPVVAAPDPAPWRGLGSRGAG